MTRAVLDTSVVIAHDVPELDDELAISAATLAEPHFGVLVTTNTSTRAERLRQGTGGLHRDRAGVTTAGRCRITAPERIADANILLYAVHSSSAFHRPISTLLRRCSTAHNGIKSNDLHINPDKD